ncbi:response regulator [Seleniivibrio sp.]|uniref:response regulator transcription factor n=1 Tax=Seleniivibrio sp. TaxID=2898801 RepID=UPI0025E40D30|nr:response regulator [Seleniivibrio sp.]MCD8554519.1 response regulator [Seleniivibrio sp.]
MKRILIVDDEVHIRSLLEQTLEDIEFLHNIEVEIHQASDGRNGLNMIASVRPDLVFLDVMMPEMNGYEVCKAVKSNSELQQTLIIMLTAKGQETDREKGVGNGADYFMTKPFDPDEVLELAGKLLGLA